MEHIANLSEMRTLLSKFNVLWYQFHNDAVERNIAIRLTHANS